jgi:hypothetical protein
MSPPRVVATRPVLSTGKQPVDQPKSRPAREAALIKAPSARSTVTAPRPHTSTVPNRQAP